MRELRIGEMLVEQGVLREHDLEKALDIQSTNRHRYLGEILVENGFASEEVVLNSLSSKLNVPIMNANSVQIQNDVIQMFEENMARKYAAMPVRIDGNRLTVMMAEPNNREAISMIEENTGFQLQPHLASRTAILKKIDSWYQQNN